MKSVLKNGKNQFAIDENRRDTYKHSLDSGHGLSILANLEGELKQLMAVCKIFFFLSFFLLVFFYVCISCSGLGEFGREKGGDGIMDCIWPNVIFLNAMYIICIKRLLLKTSNYMHEVGDVSWFDVSLRWFN